MHARLCSSTPPGLDKVLMPDGSPSRHVVPFLSPPLQWPTPPSPPEGPPISLARRHHFETWVIPHTPAMDQAEVALASALVAVVRGTRPAVSPA
jgi:hypothetical protein